MIFRATAPIQAGQEVLDREMPQLFAELWKHPDASCDTRHQGYSTPLADHFEFTLHTLAAHGMRDPVYEALDRVWASLLVENVGDDRPNRPLNGA